MKKGNDRQTGVVIIGSDFQALGAIRGFTENNIPTYLIEHEVGISRFSRYVKRREKRFMLNLKSDDFPEKLIEIAKRENLKGWMLFPNSDKIVELLSIHRDQLKDWYKIPIPSWETVQKYYFKNNAYQIAKELSIPIPRMYHAQNVDDLLSQDLNFPLVLKPTYKDDYFPVTKKKAVQVNNKQDLKREYLKMSSIIENKHIVIQEMIMGGTKNLYSFVSFFNGSNVVAGISARRLRQHPMDFGHASTYAVSIVNTELRNMAEKILKKIGYYGISEVEFMKDDKDGKFKFIEINGRVWGWHTLAKASGIDLPTILFHHVNGLEINIAEPQAGVKWIRLVTDVPTVINELFSGRMHIRDYFESIKGKKEYAVFSLKDPLPFFMEILFIPYLWWKRGY